MRDRRARGIERGEHVDRVQPLPGFRIAVGDGFERKRAGDIDEDVEPAEMRRDRVDGLLGLRRVGQIDAAKLHALGRIRDLRFGVIHAGHPRAAGQRGFRDHLAERARGAGDDYDFSVHGDLRDLRFVARMARSAIRIDPASCRISLPARRDR